MAATFNALTESVAASQRDAAQRERLSALGRLSTVIAHEIRNPADDHQGRAAAAAQEPTARPTTGATPRTTSTARSIA